jgi:hypothetical protein
VLAQEVEQDRGPSLKTVEYLIRPDDRAPFMKALTNLGDEQRRDGAFDWWLFEDVAKTGRFVETFMLDSWIEHMRQHARVTTFPARSAPAIRANVGLSLFGDVIARSACGFFGLTALLFGFGAHPPFDPAF